MDLDLWQLFAIGFVYLSVLFAVAYATEKGWIPRRVLDHPLTHVLSLGVFACSLSVFGAVHLAYHFGGGFLLYFAGASAPFFLAPLLLAPLRRITERHQLTSLADVFAFRFPGPFSGGLVAISMLIGVLPLIACQIQAVAVASHLLNDDLAERLLAVVFCVLITLFAILFGTRHVSLREQNRGLTMAIATESIIKLVLVIALAVYVLVTVFGGFGGLDGWLTSRVPSIEESQFALTDGQSRALFVSVLAAAVVLPHSFHMAISENVQPHARSVSRWGFPLYLLLLSLAIPPILWGGLYLDARTPTEYYAVGIGLAQQNKLLAILGFLVVLSATSGVLILMTSSLSAMTLNHLVLPLLRTRAPDIYSRVVDMRRVLIAIIILTGFGLYVTLAANQNLISLGVVSFAAMAQFAPGLAAAFMWRRASRRGFVAGLAAGMLVWFGMLMQPLLLSIFSSFHPDGGTLVYDLIESPWHRAIEFSLGANVLVLVIVSLLSEPTVEEEDAAYECMTRAEWIVQARELEAGSVHEIKQSLAMALGRSLSDREVDLALAELRIDADEQRPYALQKLRERMETSISGVLGQTIARGIIGNFLPYKSEDRARPLSETPQAIESRIEDFKEQLTGLAKELDSLRRYHRQTLQELPTSVCSLSPEGEVLVWNRAMSEFTGLAAEQVIGKRADSLDEPWRSLLCDFAGDSELHLLKQRLDVDGRTSWLNLHKATVEESVSRRDNLVIVIEDITQNQLLENKLIHSERLASIGQLAAGVAHEIGNPITGIACLTQNLKLESDNEEIREMSDQILEQTERISTILQSLVSFAHSGMVNGQDRTPVRLRKVVEDAILLLRLNPRNHDYLFDNQVDARLATLGDAQRLGQVFVNILHNARDASSPGDTIHIRGRIEEDRAVIEVIDQGHGIPAGYIGEVFEPFFTTKSGGQGTGLGLAIVSSIIEEHNGSIQVESPVELADDDGPVGTRFTIALPLYDPSRPRATS